MTPERFESECRAIYRDLDVLLGGLTREQFNWQPEEGRIIPNCDLDPMSARDAFDSSVDSVKALLDRAWEIELNRTRFANPFIAGLPLFNIAAAFPIALAHMRRHIAQAQGVRGRSEFPK